ncbi:cation efflux family-domain-containing protein [Kickxella alabastrina]|uniref:cation efflux family-domain-containing protein n=1 Tax=Kickxella alabastrina TaxID=61397 RepID=UPI00221EC25C|nr:cation efflux family-domain-containing protein [Kickxella alabastrina]KAI7829955.1 cation efflux family-domain-containing protein [Kickxella alabastrina]
MSPAMAAKSRSRPLTITTIDEYDRIYARKRDAYGPNHDQITDHRDHRKQQRKTQQWTRAYHILKAIMHEPESRSIFMFLLLNLSYMTVQLVYGYATNSLGLISDAIHMLFDCMALAIGLVAAVMSKWPPSETFTFGYDRIEILSGFANGVFLMLISVSIFFEAVERLIYPPEMNTQRLLLVSFGGLAVNLFGMLAFNGHHHHHHGGGGCSHSHKPVHKHSHDHDHEHCNGHDHDHDHELEHAHTHRRSQNMQGLFLHVMADTLGSVGVIISTLLIQQFGVIPLVRDSMHMLLLRLPEHSQIEVRSAINQITCSVGCITDMPRVQFWPITEEQIMGIVHVVVDPGMMSAGDEMPLCGTTVRSDIALEIGSIVRAHVSGLQDVFVQVEVKY